MLLQELHKKKLINCPKFLLTNTQYLTQMGSIAYGCSSDASDVDLYGFAIPHKEDIFGHLRGEIPDFGKQKQRFGTWQQHHVKDGEKEYDFQIFSIVKYFFLEF